MPRHPLNALTTLDRSHCQCSSSLLGFGIPILLACARRGSKSDNPDTSQVNPKVHLASVPNQLCAVTFYNGRFLTMPSTCSTDLRLRKSHKAFARYGATPSSSLAVCLKTSFSRLDPIPRGQATVIRLSIRGAQKDTNNDNPERQASFLPPSPPSFPAG